MIFVLAFTLFYFTIFTLSIDQTRTQEVLLRTVNLFTKELIGRYTLQFFLNQLINEQSVSRTAHPLLKITLPPSVNLSIPKCSEESHRQF